MAFLKGIRIECDVTFAKLKIVTLSGTVTDGTNPLKRKVLAYSHPLLTNPYSTFSSAVDGSFSIDVQVSSKDRYAVIALGEPGENSVIYDWIKE